MTTERMEKFADWTFGLLQVAGLCVGNAIIYAYEHNEIKEWSMLLEVVNDAALASVSTVIAWLMVSSPRAAAMTRELATLKAAHEELQIEHAALRGVQSPLGSKE